MHELFADIAQAANETAATLADAADQLDDIVARHAGSPGPFDRIFCPHCETWQTGDHCADDITTGIPFKSYVCLSCEGFVTTTEPSERITAEAYIDLVAVNPAAGHRWRIDRDGSYVPTAETRAA